MWFQKWHEKFGKFPPEHLKVSKLGISWCPFIQSRIWGGVMCHNNEEWCKIWRGIDLSVQNWHGEFDEFWPEHSKVSKSCTLMVCFWLKFIIFELKKVQRSHVWWHWRLMQNLKENWFALSKMTWRIWQVFAHRLKNSDLSLESKMAELNLKIFSKQPDWQDALWKGYFTLETNE